MTQQEKLKTLKQEMINFFESDAQFRADNIEILDGIILDIYNLKK